MQVISGFSLRPLFFVLNIKEMKNPSHLLSAIYCDLIVGDGHGKSFK